MINNETNQEIGDLYKEVSVFEPSSKSKNSINQHILDCIENEKIIRKKILILIVCVDRFLSISEISEICNSSTNGVSETFSKFLNSKIGKHIEKKKNGQQLFYRWIGPKEDIDKLYDIFLDRKKRKKKNKKIIQQTNGIINELDNQIQSLKVFGFDIDVKISFKGVVLYQNS